MSQKRPPSRGPVRGPKTKPEGTVPSKNYRNYPHYRKWCHDNGWDWDHDWYDYDWYDYDYDWYDYDENYLLTPNRLKGGGKSKARPMPNMSPADDYNWDAQVEYQQGFKDGFAAAIEYMMSTSNKREEPMPEPEPEPMPEQK